MKRSIKGGGGAPATAYRTAQQHQHKYSLCGRDPSCLRHCATTSLSPSNGNAWPLPPSHLPAPPPGPSAPSQPRRSPPSSHLRCTEHGDGAAPTATIPALPALPALLSKADKQSGLLSLGCPYGACRRSVRRSRFAQSAGSGHVGWRLGGYAALARVHLSCFQRRSSEPWNNSLRMENREFCLKEMC